MTAKGQAPPADGTFISTCIHINQDIISGYFKCLGETVAAVHASVPSLTQRCMYAARCMQRVTSNNKTLTYL